MYWIRTNIYRFQPLKVKCNIQMFYILEYFSTLNSPCPLYKQPKDEIIFLGTAQYDYMTVCLTT